MKLEYYECDRCGDKIEVPNYNVYKLQDFEAFGQEKYGRVKIEICGLCREALVFWYKGEEINSWLSGVVEHEKKFLARDR